MIDVVPLRAFKDNYIWTLRAGECAVVVDPGDAAPVFDYLARERLTLTAILATHHHADHGGGVDELTRGLNVPVFGPRGEPISTVTPPVSGGDRVDLPGIDVAFAVLNIPGHTCAHVTYYGANLLFCGDTLFACGCGRLFEGTPEQMHASLAKLAALPDDTLVYCGDEYTLANIGLAKMVEPDNAALAARERADRAARAEERPTLPSTIAREKATNPFLRAHEPAVIAAANKYLGARAADPVAVFTAIRDWKNRS